MDSTTEEIENLDEDKENKLPTILPPIRNSSILNKTPQLKKAKLVSKSGKFEYFSYLFNIHMFGFINSIFL
jgi:hypothetical protein